MEEQLLQLQLFNVILNITKNMKQAAEETDYFNSLYESYNDKDEYVSRMKSLSASYFLERNMKKEDRQFFVEGMIFGLDCIIDLDNSKVLTDLTENELISHINYVYDLKNSKNQYGFSKRQEKNFRRGVVATVCLSETELEASKKKLK